jgi:hypothetical protein
MSHDSNPNSDFDEEFEEISVEEIDRVLLALDKIIESVESETIRGYLETTAEEISFLIDDEEPDDLSEAA